MATFAVHIFWIINFGNGKRKLVDDDDVGDYDGDGTHVFTTHVENIHMLTDDGGELFTEL